jgi:hydrogenase maturation protease
VTPSPPSPPSPEPPLVIGLGDPHGGDSALAGLVARRLQPVAGGKFRILCLEGEPTALMEAWCGAPLVIVVTAVQSGREPGAIIRHEWPANPLAEAASPGADAYAMTIGMTIEQAQTLGQMPERLVVYGVECRQFEADAPVAEAAQHAVTALVARILEEIEQAQA